MKGNPLVIDGNNVIFSVDHKNGNLDCLAKLIEIIGSTRPVYPIISYELKYRLATPSLLPSYIRKYGLLVTPVGVDTDIFILETARELDADIASNDRFRKYRKFYPEVIKRRFPFLIFLDHDGALRVIFPTIPTLGGERTS